MRLACIVTLGCPRNEADSDLYAGCLTAAGWRLTDEPGRADLLLLNTCAFIRPAVEESLEALGSAIEWRTERPGRTLVLAGCLPGRYERDDSGGLEDIDLVVGPGEWRPLCAMLGADRPPLPVPSARVHCRYLRVAEGCPNRCSYCTIPAIRGALACRSSDELLEESSLMVRTGAREIGVVAQDTGSWREGGDGLPELLLRLSDALPETWLRLYYLHPARFSDRLLSVLEERSNVMPYLDLPVQHVSDRVLARMGRPYGGREVEDILERVSSARREIAVRLTVMVGYPGETEEDGERLVRAISGSPCVRTVVAFPYWHEEGTEEYRRSSEYVPPGDVSSRLSRVGEAAERAWMAWAGRMEGRRIRVMLDGDGLGHSELDAPFVDRPVLLPDGGDGTPGEVVESVVQELDAEGMHAAPPDRSGR